MIIPCKARTFQFLSPYKCATFLWTPYFFAASLAVLRRSSLYGADNEKAQPIFVDCALLDGNCSMNFFTKSLLLEMTHENLIRRLQGFVILAVSGAKLLHCGNEYIVIAALTLELL